jgi:hypothetical protein
MIASANIGKRLDNIPHTALIDAGYIEGDFEPNEPSTGSITMAATNIDGLKIKADLFLDSNQIFDVPVSAPVRERVVIAGSDATMQIIDHESTFKATLVGTANVPSMFANATLLPLLNLVLFRVIVLF